MTDCPTPEHIKDALDAAKETISQYSSDKMSNGSTLYYNVGFRDFAYVPLGISDLEVLVNAIEKGGAS